MAYFLRTVDAGMTREVEKWKRAPREDRKEKRERRGMPTPEAMEEVNRLNALRRLRLDINANMRPGDYWLTMTYAPTGEKITHEESFRDYTRFIRDCRTLYKKHGVVLRYFAVSEHRESHRPHHHLLLPQGVPVGELQAIWPFGRIRVTPLDGTGQYRRLASYMMEHTAHLRGKKKWNSSKNLEHPRAKEREVAAKHWKDAVTAPKGWRIDKESEIERGVNPITGAEYLRYTLIRTEPNEKIHKSQHSSPRVCAGGYLKRGEGSRL